VKERLRSGDSVAQGIALSCLDHVLRLLHPIMPFVSEELWSLLPGSRDLLMRAPWPELQLADAEAEATFGQVMAIVEEVRGHRQAAGAPPRGGMLYLDASTDSTVASLASRLAWTELSPAAFDEGIPLGTLPGRVSFPVAAGDNSRSKAQLKRLMSDLERTEAQLANPEFRANAPFDVVRKLEERAAETRAAIDRLSA
jgi:valyl-tRNA synthetase